MNITDIDWTDRSWNPVTGCLHKCPYCYARNQARRFAGHDEVPTWKRKMFVEGGHTRYEIETRLQRTTKSGKIVSAAYPFGFVPTFHEYRLDEPQHYKKPQTIFVGSMCDLFGEWVPDEWIKEVIKACEKAPQHTYIFLTKNYKRYEDLIAKKILPSIMNTHYYFGHSITTQKDADSLRDWICFHSREKPEYKNLYWISRFMSVEPLHEDINILLKWFRVEWVIIGAETGNRKGKIIPKKEWIKNILFQCYSEMGHQTVPVFMKDSLAEIWKKPLIQEYPW